MGQPPPPPPGSPPPGAPPPPGGGYQPPYRPPPPGGGYPPGGGPPSEPLWDEQPRGGGNRGLIAGIVGGVLLLALLGGGGAWILLAGDDDADLPPAPQPEPTEATEAPPEDSDIEVRLTWSSHADLDLEVVDPDGDWVSHAATEVPSGGLLEADANGNCEATTDRPSEYIRWPERAAPTGEFAVQVSYPLQCDGGRGPQDYGLQVILDGETVASFNDVIEPDEVLGLLSFSYPGGDVDDWRQLVEEEEAEAAIATVEDLPSGLFCRDLAPQGFAYWEAVAYWELEGRPTRMDASNNGIPCETIYPASEVRDYWGDLYPGSTGSPVPPRGVTAVENLPSGLFCRDLYAMGYPYWDAVRYWELEGWTTRMDASNNGIPCQTVYPWADVRDYWGAIVDSGFEEGGDVPGR